MKKSWRFTAAFGLACALLLAGCGQTGRTADAYDAASGEQNASESESAEESASDETSSDAEAASSEEESAPHEESLSTSEKKRWNPGEEIPAEDVEDDSRKIVFLILPSEEGLDATEEEILTSALEENYDIAVRTHGDDIEAQTEAFDEAVETEACLIICDNVLSEETLESVQNAREAGIPTILLNNGMGTTGVALSQVITDRYSCIGKLAEAFAEKKEKKAQYLVVTNEDDPQSEDFLEAFRDSVSAYPKIHEVTEISAAGKDTDTLGNEIVDAVRKNPEIDSIVCWSGEEAEAVLEVLGASSLGSKTVYCIDGDLVSDEIGSDGISAAILKPAEDLADLAAREAVSYLSQGTTGQNECIYYEGKIVTEDDPEEADAADPENESTSS